MLNELIIISNEKFDKDGNNFYCDNVAEKSLPDELTNFFSIKIIGRISKKKRAHKLKTNNIKLFNSLFFYLIYIFKNINKKKSKFLLLSISPYTFFASLLFFFSKKKPIIYLRSDGYKEYRSILGFYGPMIYSLMFNIASKVGQFVSCNQYILKKKKGFVVNPSEINENWITNTKKTSFKKIKLLYIGRVKVEKGIFSLLKIMKNSKIDISLSIVGATQESVKKISQKNVSIFGIQNNELELIKFYDNHNIFILPSFTEGHPMVLLEALARQRPVIIFKEIDNIVGNFKGIFVAERSTNSFFETINHIKSNYEKIYLEMKSNVLPTKKQFIGEFGKFILNSD